MNIVVLKRSKEYNQGVGYLDVNHGGRGPRSAHDWPRGRDYGHERLQTASGKMIFGKLRRAPLSRSSTCRE